MWGRYHVGLGLAALGLGLVGLALDVWSDRVVVRTGSAAGGPPASAGAGGAAHPLGPLAWPLGLVSLTAVWASVPDTEPPLVFGAALAPLALHRWWRRRSPGLAATAVLVAAVVAAALGGAAGRVPAAMTWSAVGAVLVAPLLAGFHRRWRPGAGLVAVAVVHAVVAVAGSRIIMRLPPGWAVVGAACSLTTVAVAVALTRPGTVAT